MRVSVGVCAYNEEKNIGRLLYALVKEPFEKIWVLADGCTDQTVNIVTQYWRENSNKINVVVKEKRSGKANAVNSFLHLGKGNDVLVLISADVVPSNFCFKYMLARFDDKGVGMVGTHPIPTNSLKSSMGRVSHLMWEMHHRSAMIHPKAGEACAFRNVVGSIDPKTSVDEASIEQQVVGQGYKVVYEPRAVVFNRGPETESDFLKQRKRIYHGHLALKEAGYVVPTMSYINLARVGLPFIATDPLVLLKAMWLETEARYIARKALGKEEYNPTVWEMCNSTKEV
jgi:poly-beta-1,6-N-acetyl-D-glucosamine synthase